MARARRPPDLAFVLAAEALKHQPRAGWKRVGVKDGESVADHSWRLALMAMVYADLLGLDGGRAARIALLHDLPEARTGDFMPGQVTPYRKHALEERALRALLKPLPPALQKKYMVLWQDYELGGSPEAQLVEELDKLEMVAQAVAYERRGRSLGNMDGFWATADKLVRTPYLRERVEALRRMRPHKPTKRSASSTSARGARASRKRYSRSPRTR